MNDDERAFRQMMDKMIGDYGLTLNDIKTLAEFNASVESGKYLPRLNKKMFNLVSKKNGNSAFC